MRTLTLLIVACLCAPVALALPGLQATLPTSDAGMAGAAFEAGPAKFSSTLLIVPGVGTDHPFDSGSDDINTADASAQLRASQGVEASANGQSIVLPIPLLPDGLLYVGAGTFRDGTGFGELFKDSIIVLERELPRLVAGHTAGSTETTASSPDAAPQPLPTPQPRAAPGPLPQRDDKEATAAPTETSTLSTTGLERISVDTLTLAAAAGLGLGILTLLGLALYSRIRPSATLANDTRKTIFEAVCANPGLGVQELSKTSGVSYSTTTYHLERLASAGMIVMTPEGNKLRYYQNGGNFSEAERRILPLLKNTEAARVLDAIASEPGTYRTQLAQRLGVTTTTINWHLRRLFEAGLIRETRQGRNAYLYPSPQATQSLQNIAEKLQSEEPPVAELARRCATAPAGAS